MLDVDSYNLYPCLKADRNMKKLLNGLLRIYSRAWKSLYQYMKQDQSKITCMAWDSTTALDFGSLPVG